jgi:hypothetical protein
MSAQPNYVSLGMLLGIDPSDEDFWQHACDLRVAVPAVVVSFNATKQTVVVQPAVQENIFQNLVPTPINLPQLADVPIIIPRAGGFAVTLPITAGDECLVVFADMCINAWWSQGAPTDLNQPMPNQEERRRHDLSDGFAILGPWSQPRVLSDYSTSALEVRSDDGNTVIEVASGSVTMTPDGGTSEISITPGTINLTATTVNINGQSYALHTHSGVMSGGSDTGPVVP